MRARRRINAAALSNRSRPIRFGTVLQPTCSNPGPTCAPFNSCWDIAVWLPRPAIYASLPAKCARLPAPSICFHSPLPLNQSPLQYSTSSSGTWMAPSLRWPMCFATTAKLIVKNMAQTLLAIAADPKHLGAEIGFFAVLHTWGSNLLHHPHLHCVVPGGGLSPNRTQWISCQAGFFLSVRVLSRLFRRLFLEHLLKAFDAGKLAFYSSLESLRDRSSFLDYLAPLREVDWVVYAKRPFAGPEQVLDYVGRYTHRVAISNNRLLDIAAGKVTFRYKDYRHGAQQKTMTLEADEFIRCFLLHVLPDGFQRIRYYGFLANRYREQKLTCCRELLDMPAPEPPALETKNYRERYEELTGSSLWQCSVCHRGRMLVIEILPRSPHRKMATTDTS